MRVNGIDVPHKSHIMLKPTQHEVIQNGQKRIENNLNNECSVCGHKMWGIAGDWNNDTELETICKQQKD